MQQNKGRLTSEREIEEMGMRGLNRKETSANCVRVWRNSKISQYMNCYNTMAKNKPFALTLQNKYHI